MGLLRLLTFPVSMPVAGGTWVLQTLIDEAERRYYDESAIRQKMAQLERRFMVREIDEATFDAEEEELFARLLEARDYRMRKEEERNA